MFFRTIIYYYYFLERALFLRQRMAGLFLISISLGFCFGGLEANGAVSSFFRKCMHGLLFSCFYLFVILQNYL